VSRARQIAAIAASDPGGATAWLDGGEGRGFFALEVDREIVADDLSALDTVEALWRAEPQYLWFGWLTYEVGVDALIGRAPHARALPGLVLRRYRAALELGERERIHGEQRAGEALISRLDRAEVRSENAQWALGRVRALIDPEDYRARVRRAQEFIAAGDTYQINFTQPFAASWRPEWVGLPIAARAAAVYSALREKTPATMGALLAAEVGRPCARWIVSNSPETLVAVEFARARRR
jgi:anthranilate/para-aminobenzoate synthase component I